MKESFLKDFLIKLVIGLSFIMGCCIITTIPGIIAFIGGCLMYTLGYFLMDVYKNID